MNDLRQRNIAIVTSTRADWGLLSPIAKELNSRSDCHVDIVATNMHLDPHYGNTAAEIEADGLTIARRVPMSAASDSNVDTARAMAQCLDAMAQCLDDLRPDLVVILGDRYEMLAVASAAMMLRIPIAHLHGGEVSEGAIDDRIRHAITKLADLHLTSTEAYRRRVIQMGENPAHVINTGAIGVYNMAHEPVMTLDELTESLDGWELGDNALLVTLHPATADDTPTHCQAEALFDALDHFPQCRLIITYPNNDPQGNIIIDLITRYARRWGDRVKVVPSLGKRRYLSALRYVKGVIGNSSSGIIEVPSAGIPTVDIGMRQHGRIAAPSVIHAESDPQSIARAIALALSDSMRQLASHKANPYLKPDTLRLIVEAIATTPLGELRSKHFNDLPTTCG